jgi:transcription termination/antitermination protein NusG
LSKSWYIVHVTSGHEKSVLKAIEEQAARKGLQDYFENILVPTESVIELRRGQKVNSEKKFLPGYMLIKMEMNEQTWHMIRNIPKVSKFLGLDGKPQKVSEAEVQRILKQIEEGIVAPKSSLVFENGESIKVIDGPFESFVGSVVDVDNEKCRVKVSVSIFGRSTPVDLDFTQIEKI